MSDYKTQLAELEKQITEVKQSRTKEIEDRLETIGQEQSELLLELKALRGTEGKKKVGRPAGFSPKKTSEKKVATKGTTKGASKKAAPSES